VRIYEFGLVLPEDYRLVSKFSLVKVVIGFFGLLWKLYILVVFTITALLFYPVIVPFLNSDKNRRKAFKLFVVWSWVVRILCIYFVRFAEKSKLPEGHFVIIANHASYLDIFLMPSLFPNTPFLFLGKSEILSYPLIKTYFKKLNIPVYRDNKLKAARALFQAVEAGRNGWSLVIFPEGGIPDNEQPFLDDFKLGAFQIARSVKAPIVPVTFVNNFKLFSDPEHILGEAHPGVSKVHVHPFISAEDVCHGTLEELSAKCHEVIKKTLQQHYPDFK